MATPSAHALKKATISDVARHAGVSIKTVSRVLNREPKVRPATRERIESAMKTLNYRPNSPGRMLAGNRTYLLGLIYNASSSYITRIQNGVLESCRGEHYDLLIHPCKYTDPSLLDEIRELVDAPRVDGLLLVPPVSDLPSVRELVAELNVPNVVISRESVSTDDWAVCTNDREVSGKMVKHLARLGHERIAFIQAQPDHKAMANRYTGYVDAMTDAGLKVRKQLVVQGENSFESGIDCALRLLRRSPRPTAIFCANDHMAAGVLKAAHEMGLSIPADLSIAGFDDMPMAQQIWPALTTVRQPLDEMARRAAEMLIRGLRGEDITDIPRIVDADIVVRASTGPAPKNNQ
ncbi:MAG: LacI family DNA-binding transcriptional regulator [Pseudomonadota bacterium]